ncbi:unnamed protein product [Schistosoma mattheei]|uniref:Uncharacterized protein n=1 Tax=Schistosoma mattheei TaxID=31246 RepID=A0A183Q6X8_9TREM|nr:unnamed protein product [Schistosoma mattheei]
MCYLLRSTAEKLMRFKSVLPNPVNSNETAVDNNQILDKLVQSDDDNDEQENVPPSSQMKSDPDVTSSLISVNVPAFLLSRFLALIGHITLKQLVFMESAVLTELKRRALIQEDRDSKRKSKSRKNIRQSRVCPNFQSFIKCRCFLSLNY